MRRSICCAVALVTACSEPTPVEAPLDGGVDVGRDSGTTVVRPPPPSDDGLPPSYFLATASMPFLRRYYVDGLSPQRLTPVRGAGYDRGDGTIEIVGQTPSERLVVVKFSPVAPDRPSALYAVPLDGFNPDDPILIADDVGSTRTVVIDDDRIAFRRDDGIVVARLDGSTRDSNRVIEVPGAESILGLMFGPSHLHVLTRPFRTMVVRSYDLDDSTVQPFEHAPNPTSGDGTQIAAVLPDGRLLLTADRGSYVADPTGRVPPVTLDVVAPWYVTSSASGAEIVVRGGSNSHATYLVVDLTVEPYRVDTELVLSEVVAETVSADRRSVFVMGYQGTGLKLFHVSTSGAPSTVMADLPNNVRRSMFAPADGRFVVFCASGDLHRVAVSGRETIYDAGCLNGTLQGVDAAGTRALLIAAGGAYAVSLEDGTRSFVGSSGTFVTALSDGIVTLAYDDGFSTIYRMDRHRRMERRIPWGQTIEEAHVIGARVLYRRQDGWYVVEGEGRTSPRLVAAGSDLRLVGVTSNHVVLVAPQALYSYRLDGGDVGGYRLPAPDPFLTHHVLKKGHYVWSTATGSIMSLRVAKSDPPTVATEIHSYENGRIGLMAWDAEAEAVIIVATESGRTSVTSVSVDGATIVRYVDELAVPSSAVATSIAIIPSTRRALVTYRNGRLATLVMSVPLNGVTLEAEQVGKEGQILWEDAGAPGFLTPDRVLLNDTSGIHIASWNGGDSTRILDRNLFRVPGMFMSADGAWVMGRSSRGLVAFDPESKVEAIVVAEDPVDAAFLPTGEIAFTSETLGGGVPLAFKIAIGAEEAEPLTTHDFRVDRLVRVDKDGLVLRSLDGGDFSYYFLEHGSMFPTPLTPIDDAFEAEINALSFD